MMSIVARSVRVSAVSCAAALALLLSSVCAFAEPGLWVATGPNATVYLFGTVHLLRKDQPWETPRIAKALASSQELWLEIPDPGDATEAQRLIGALGFDREHPLSTKLTPAVLAHLDQAAKAAGFPEGERTLEPMRPWLASVALEDAMVVHSGFDPNAGAEETLLHEAHAAGKSVRGFETMEQQMHFLADLSPALEIQMLQNTLQDFDEGPQKLEALVDAWLKGDTASIARTMVDEVRQPSPELYRRILVARNEAWADAIAKMVEQPGVRFVAVGAAHLAGPDSVQVALQRRGVPVAQLLDTR